MKSYCLLTKTHTHSSRPTALLDQRGSRQKSHVELTNLRRGNDKQIVSKLLLLPCRSNLAVSGLRLTRECDHRLRTTMATCLQLVGAVVTVQFGAADQKYRDLTRRHCISLQLWTTVYGLARTRTQHNPRGKSWMRTFPAAHLLNPLRRRATFDQLPPLP